MAKIVIEIDSDNIEDSDLLKLITHKDLVLATIFRLNSIRWKHIENADHAREAVGEIISPFFNLFE